MPQRPAIPGLWGAMKKKLTRLEPFLADVDAGVPPARPPMPLETMGGIDVLQNRHALSDPMAAETLQDGEAGQSDTEGFSGRGAWSGTAPDQGAGAIPGLRPAQFRPKSPLRTRINI